MIGELGARIDRGSEEEPFFCEERTSVRFVLAYSPQIDREVREERQARLSRADGFVAECLRKLTAPASRGRKATPQGTCDRIRDDLRDHPLLSLYKCVLALQIERLMRRRLESVSVHKAIDRLRRIKAGEVRLGGVMTRTLTRTTKEQLNLFKSLDIPPPRMTKTDALQYETGIVKLCIQKTRYTIYFNMARKPASKW